MAYLIDPVLFRVHLARRTQPGAFRLAFPAPPAIPADHSGVERTVMLLPIGLAPIGTLGKKDLSDERHSRPREPRHHGVTTILPNISRFSMRSCGSRRFSLCTWDMVGVLIIVKAGQVGGVSVSVVHSVSSGGVSVQLL